MARKRKNKNSGMQMAVPSSGHERMGTDISKAENGFVVNVHGEKGGNKPEFFHKQFVAHSRPDAMRIAAAHFAGSLTKGKGGRKKGGKKRSAKLG